MKYKKFYFAIFACFLLFRVLPVEASSYGQGAIAGYTYEEPGRWERTDMLYFGPLEETLQVGGLTISAVWTENYKDMVYTFTATNGAQSQFTVTPYWIDDFYYSGNTLSAGVNIVHEAEPSDMPGDVICSLAFADLKLGTGDYGFEPTVRWYCKTMKGEEVRQFSIHENMIESSGSDGKKFYFDPRGEFPVGEEDGEKIYLLFGTMDDQSGDMRMFTAYEYTWKDEPEIIEVPDQFGPIEYFDSVPDTNLQLKGLNKGGY